MPCTGCGGELNTRAEYRTATCSDCLKDLQTAAANYNNE